VGPGPVARGARRHRRGARELAVGIAERLGAAQERALLTARLADVALRRGDVAAAERTALLAEEYAERCGAWDPRNYARQVRACVALYRGETALARRLADAARRDLGRGTPPPIFHVAAHGLSGRIRVAEGDPARGLAECCAGLRVAQRQRCDERLYAAVLEWAALACAASGRPGTGARLLGAATALRAGLPRPAPEARDAEAVRAAAEAALGRDALERALAEGAALDRREALALAERDLAALEAPV
jgi:hypothetical protein